MILLDNIVQLVRSVPSFTLNLSLKGPFWEEVERALGWAPGGGRETEAVKR
jgi:hypothetical protein